MMNLPAGTRFWLVAGITDMRNGLNGLGAKVQTALKDDPMSGHVFIFRGSLGSQVRLLWSTGDGLCLLTKRLERGRLDVGPRRQSVPHARATRHAAGGHRLGPAKAPAVIAYPAVIRFILVTRQATW